MRKLRIAGDAKKVKAYGAVKIEKDNAYLIIEGRPAPTNYTSFNIFLWTPMDVIGMKGKSITQYTFRANGIRKDDSRRHWQGDVEDLLEHSSTLNEGVIDGILKKVGSEFLKEEGGELTIYKNKEVLKAMDHSIPLPSSLNLHDFSGKDISVEYKTGFGVRIISKQDMDLASKGRMVRYLLIPQSLSNIKKIEALKSKLMSCVGLESVIEILNSNKISYKRNTHMDLGWD